MKTATINDLSQARAGLIFRAFTYRGDALRPRRRASSYARCDAGDGHVISIYTLEARYHLH